jgi:recombination protein RecR
MDPIHRLAQLFSEFPGIGTRQSKRFVYFLLKQNRSYIDELVRQIQALEQNILECARCHRYFTKRFATAGPTCGICSDQERDRSILMVVEKDSDLEAIEKSGTYSGTYFVLGGTLPILEKEPEKRIRVELLTALIEEEYSDLKEVILACAVTPESEHTAEYVREYITPIAETNFIKLTSLGRGLSTGTELEYSDAETLRYALEGRK